ncbi:hypothetical protein GWN63_05585, partial [Candidatus Bathyarchaeota archaeon]|nr:hypothetical protein [Candidatus Bathyarchaeota archaeon]NIR16569.1 hypothetical protein [Desulfobacterales bacterium]NIU81694.1 hypothetical protein [Candidatus Bathyarchaeota archaeon]NIV68340.1 hypothetical protein [Candidatus Bathyarchaeota archaeon]
SDYHLLRKHLAENEALNHPKIAVLKSEIRRHLKNNPSTRILVFTQYRDTATHLVQELKSLHHVEAERFVGQASKEDDPGLSQEEQAQILQDFREGNLNVLVATSIAEEGLDIPAVDLVLFYEPIPSGIRHIQRKGRTGRKNIGRTVILAAKETADIAYLYASKRRIQKMRSIVTGLETQLPDFPRKGVKPPSNPMPKSMIAEEKPSEAPEGRVQEDVEELRRFNRQVDRVAKSLWMKVMKAGAEGLSVEALQEGLLSDYSTSVIKAAIDRLQEAEQIIKLGSDRIASAASLKGTEDKESYQVEVERILPGRAVCLINDRWRARLLPEEYEGPSQLIKKNMRFRATGNLFRDGDTLCLRVRRVTRIL